MSESIYKFFPHNSNYLLPIPRTPNKAFVSFNPTFNAMYLYYTDIVSNHTVTYIDIDMTVSP